MDPSRARAGGLPRAILVCLTILAILLPRMSGAVAAALPGSMTPGAMTIVLCTGDGLRTITIGPDGKPTEVAHEVMHCLLVHACDTAPPLALRPPLDAAPEVVAPSRADGRVPPLEQAARPPPRAPPAA